MKKHLSLSLILIGLVPLASLADTCPVEPEGFQSLTPVIEGYRALHDVKSCGIRAVKRNFNYHFNESQAITWASNSHGQRLDWINSRNTVIHNERFTIAVPFQEYGRTAYVQMEVLFRADNKQCFGARTAWIVDEHGERIRHIQLQ